MVPLYVQPVALSNNLDYFGEIKNAHLIQCRGESTTRINSQLPYCEVGLNSNLCYL
jgi:hypothetical protein